ncbi:hypothetical protein BD309DRAFT_954122 [Dichomitus squalens]|nr:hypothetical protein BD309DRAFT_954122 [Dichomitus squalens]
MCLCSTSSLCRSISLLFRSQICSGPSQIRALRWDRIARSPFRCASTEHINTVRRILVGLQTLVQVMPRPSIRSRGIQYAR